MRHKTSIEGFIYTAFNGNQSTVSFEPENTGTPDQTEMSVKALGSDMKGTKQLTLARNIIGRCVREEG